MPLRTFCVRVAGPAMLIAVLVNGCAMMGPRLGFAPPACANPLYVASYNENAVWEATVDVLHEFHFDIARENKLSHVIETAYFTGSNVAEPWHADSVGLENRLESTFQSIRRRVIVNVIPDERGQGFLVSVEAFKELEDLDGLAANSVGAATFDEFEPLRRDLNPVVGQSAPSGWLPQGRDLALESAVLTRLQQVYSSR